MTEYNIFGSTVPGAVRNDPGTRPVVLGTLFRTREAGSITKLRCYWSNGADGYQTIKLWDALTGTELASVDISSAGGGGWVEGAITPVVVTPGVNYVVSFFTSDGGYPATSGYFNGSGAPATPIYSPETNSLLNGVFDYRADHNVMPVSGGSGGSYFADAVFVPSNESTKYSSLNSILPVTVDVADGALSWGTRFRSSEDGQVLGIRVYWAAGSRLFTTAKLWTAAGTELASVDISDKEGGGGWYDIAISPVSITAGIDYVASVHSDNGGYSVTAFGFSSAITNGPLTAPADGDSGLGNGLFRYDASHLMPNGSFNSSNYFVDVLFLPEGAPAPATHRRRPFMLFS